MVRRSRGDAEREWASFIRCSNAEFGVLVNHCTVTPGGAPPARTDDAVSSNVASVALGKLTVTDFTDCVSDGEDISQISLHVKFLKNSHSNNFPCLGRPALLAQLLIVLKESPESAPFFVRFPPRYHSKFLISVSFKIWVLPLSTLGSSLCLSPVTSKIFSSSFVELVTFAVHSNRAFTFALWVLLFPAPKPICNVCRTNSVAHVSC